MTTRTSVAVISSPVGLLKLEASEKGLTSIRLLNKKVLSAVAPQKGAKAEDQVSPQGAVLKQAVKELEEYFEGKRTSFDVPLDASGTDFQKQTWKELSKVKYGKTVSYADLAAKIGRPKAVRAVGTAMGKNPLCIIVPCHRVLPKGGGVGSYAYGEEMKQRLLDFEQSKMSSIF